MVERYHDGEADRWLGIALELRSLGTHCRPFAVLVYRYMEQCMYFGLSQTRRDVEVTRMWRLATPSLRRKVALPALPSYQLPISVNARHLDPALTVSPCAFYSLPSSFYPTLHCPIEPWSRLRLFLSMLTLFMPLVPGRRTLIHL